MLSPFFSPNIGGVETHLDDLCTYLAKRRHKIVVLTYQPLTTKQKAEHLTVGTSMAVRRINWIGHNLFPKLESYPLLEFIYLTPILFVHAFLFSLIHKNEIDVIHAHGLNAAFIAKFLSAAFKKRSVVSMHAIYSLDKRSLMAKAVNMIMGSADVVFALAERSRRDLIGAGLSSDKIKIYSQWVDQEKFRPLDSNQCKKELFLNGQFIVLFVGRFIEKKGVKVLLQVASKVSSGVTFVFVGDGPLANVLREKATVQKNVVFAGKVSEHDKITYYNAADVVIVPSQYDEGFARVVLEALSCGIPVVAANRGCLPEMIDSSVGFLVDASVENLTTKIEALSKSEELRKLRINCRKYSELNFSEKNAETIEKAYLPDLR